MTKWQVLIILSFWMTNAFAATPLKKMPEKPNLLVVIVIDQLRADYLTRFDKRFLPATSKEGVGGFKYLTTTGAYFPAAEYDVIQSMTCPGHAMILTGAHPVMNGIVLNDWYDKVQRKKVYCAEDDKHGLSPKNLKTSTFGDELKGAGYPSRVVGIALKDRAAIMLAGHRADEVYWFNDETFEWETSTFYSPDKKLPNWVTKINENLKPQKDKEYIWENKDKPTGLSDDSTVPFKRTAKDHVEAIPLPYGVDITLDMATAAVKDLKLGKGKGPDILAISLSSHDMLGHKLGPNSRDMEEMTVYEDRALAKFFNTLKKEGVLSNSLIVLTADHGVAPTVEFSKKGRFDAEKIDYATIFKNINAHLDKKFGKPKDGASWMPVNLTMNFYFDRKILADKGINLEDAEREAKSVLLDEPGVMFVITSSEFRNGVSLPAELKTRYLNQYDIEKGGDLFFIPTPFSVPQGKGANHLTGFAYDRTVPIIFAGKNIKAGVYPEQAKVIDIAPTLAFMYGVIPPATHSGKILEIFQ
jgi:predicted AlkP superfamily pyrophosphatase or phosphodiesterase